MTIKATLNRVWETNSGGTELQSAMRLPGGEGARPFSLSEAAEKGRAATSGFNVEDPAASASIGGLRNFDVEESACATVRTFTGYTTDRTIGRGQASLRAGSERAWDVDVVDLNELLGDTIITGSDGKRPAETDIDRILWFIASDYSLVGWGHRIDVTNAVMLEAADYIGRTGADVLADCSNLSGKNYYVYWDPDTLFWSDPPAAAEGAVSITRYPSDQDNGQWWEFIGHPLLNGKRVLMLYNLNANQVFNDLEWRDGGQPTQHDEAGPGPWLDIYGNRVSRVVWNRKLNGGGGIAGPYTMDSGFTQVDYQGWTMAVRVADVNEPYYPLAYWLYPGYAFGWYYDRWDGMVLHYDDGDYLGPLTAAPILPRPGPALAYHPTVWADLTATLQISNDLDDVDMVTTFPPAPGDSIRRSPERVYSGVNFDYSGGRRFVERAATESAFRRRETTGSDMGAKTAAAADALGAAYLERAATEEDRGTFHIGPVPESRVNLALPGQRILVKLQHAPGYETGTYLAITGRTVEPLGSGLYALTLECSLPVVTGFHGPGHQRTVLRPTRGMNLGAVVSPANLAAPDDLVRLARVPWTHIAYGDGATTSWTVDTAYVAGSLQVKVDGVIQIPTEDDPTTGAFSLGFAPVGDGATALTSENVTASWQVA